MDPELEPIEVMTQTIFQETNPDGIWADLDSGYKQLWLRAVSKGHEAYWTAYETRAHPGRHANHGATVIDTACGYCGLSNDLEIATGENTVKTVWPVQQFDDGTFHPPCYNARNKEIADRIVLGGTE